MNHVSLRPDTASNSKPSRFRSRLRQMYRPTRRVRTLTRRWNVLVAACVISTAIHAAIILIEPLFRGVRSVAEEAGSERPQLPKALRGASEAGDVLAIRIFLTQGASPNAPDEDGWSPLMFAVANRRLEAARVLLAAGAVINHRAQDGATPLILAAIQGDPELVTVLLEAGANPLLDDGKGSTPFVFAQRRGHGRVAELLAAKSREAAPATPQKPYGPFFGSVQLGMNESELRERFGRRWDLAERPRLNLIVVKRYLLFGAWGDLELELDQDRRLVRAHQRFRFADTLAANTALSSIESWSSVPKRIDTTATTDVGRRVEKLYAITISYEQQQRSTDRPVHLAVELAANRLAR